MGKILQEPTDKLLNGFQRSHYGHCFRTWAPAETPSKLSDCSSGWWTFYQYCCPNDEIAGVLVPKSPNPKTSPNQKQWFFSMILSDFSHSTVKTWSRASAPAGAGWNTAATGFAAAQVARPWATQRPGDGLKHVKTLQNGSKYHCLGDGHPVFPAIYIYWCYFEVNTRGFHGFWPRWPKQVKTCQDHSVIFLLAVFRSLKMSSSSWRTLVW